MGDGTETGGAARAGGPISRQDFGRHLRALRGRVPLRELARDVNSSRAALSRFERGERLPPPDLATRLDAHFRLGGRLLALYERTRRGALSPSSEAAFKTRWVHNYPAAYSGEIFMRLVVPPEAAPAPIDLRARWGPWTVERQLLVDCADGLALWHTKGDDGLSIPLVIETSAPVRVSFHTGSAPDGALDFNAGWRHDGGEL